MLPQRLKRPLESSSCGAQLASRSSHSQFPEDVFSATRRDKEVDSNQIVHVCFFSCPEVGHTQSSCPAFSHRAESLCWSWGSSCSPPRQDLANTLRTKARRPASSSQPNTPRIARTCLLSLRSLSSVVPLSIWIRANAPLNSRRSRSARFGPFFTLIHSDPLQSSQYYQLQFARK